jgi:hypothetical protein
MDKLVGNSFDSIAKYLVAFFFDLLLLGFSTLLYLHLIVVFDEEFVQTHTTGNTLISCFAQQARQSLGPER